MTNSTTPQDRSCPSRSTPPWRDLAVSIRNPAERLMRLGPTRFTLPSAPIAAALSFLLAALTGVTPAAPSAWVRHTIDDSARGADGVRLADVNGDGRPDITTGFEEGGVVRAYLNPDPTKAKETWPAVTVGQVRDVEDAVFVDLDGDGALDVVSSAEGRTRAMFVHWAPKERARLLDPAAWRTEPLSAAQGAMMWMFCTPAQLDGRHGMDLIAGGKGAGAALGWFQAPADPRRLADWQWRPLRDVGWIMSILAVDMDSDGDLDILFTDRKGARTGCFWLENPGADALASAPAAGKPTSPPSGESAGVNGHRPWKEHLIGGAGREVMFATVADLDGDGLDDVLVATKPRDILWFRRLDRTGRSWETHPIPQPENTGTAKAVAVGDLDLDGRPDIVFTCEQATPPRHGAMWLTNPNPLNAAGWRARPLGGVDGVKHDLVQLLDLDGDGDLDVLTCEEVKNLGVLWYENPAR